MPSAVRFTTGTDYYFNTAGMIAVAPFTVAFWGKIVVDRNNFSTFCGFDLSTANQFLMETAVDGTNLALYHVNSTERLIGQLTVGTWYKIAYVVSGTTITCWRAAAGSAVASAAAGSYTAFTPTTFDIGNCRRTNEFLNGSVAAVKIWAAALTQAELDAEFTQYDPIRVANLNRYYSFGWGPQTVDQSGNGRTLTQGAAAPTEDTAGPPIPVSIMRHPLTIPRPAAVADSFNW
jgi:hypothetical protein